MSEPCIRCGEPASRELRALQVRTLPIRSLAGEKRVQALGEEVTAHVCEACAAKQLNFLKDVRGAVRKKVLVFGGVLAGGIIITALTLLLNRERILLMPGIGAVICGVLGRAGPVRGIYTFLRFGVWILLGWSLTAAAVLLFLIGALSRKTAKGCGIAIIIIGVLCMALSFCLSFCGLHYYPASNPDDYEVEVYWNEGDNWDISSETTHRYGVKRTRSTFAVPLFITGRTMDHDAYFSYSTGTACTRFPLSRGLLCIVLGLGCLGGAIWEKKDLVKSGEYPPYPAYKIPTNRSMWKMLLLGFITCGIYPAIISFYMHEDINLIASPHDGRRTMHPFAALMLGYITCGIYYLVWWHKLCNRIGDELDRRRQNYQFSASAFWLWNILGSLILVGPLVFLHKYCTAMNCLADDYNRHG